MCGIIYTHIKELVERVLQFFIALCFQLSFILFLFFYNNNNCCCLARPPDNTIRIHNLLFVLDSECFHIGLTISDYNKHTEELTAECASHSSGKRQQQVGVASFRVYSRETKLTRIYLNKHVYDQI